MERCTATALRFGKKMNDEKRWSDRALGMNRSIRRRDFLNGVAIAIGAGLAGSRSAAALAGESWPQDRPGYYPPLLTGRRGSHPGSFETAHALRNADFWQNHPGIKETGERYDLVVVGGGISGLS